MRLWNTFGIHFVDLDLARGMGISLVDSALLVSSTLRFFNRQADVSKDQVLAKPLRWALSRSS